MNVRSRDEPSFERSLLSAAIGLMVIAWLGRTAARIVLGVAP